MENGAFCRRWFKSRLCRVIRRMFGVNPELIQTVLTRSGDGCCTVPTVDDSPPRVTFFFMHAQSPLFLTVMCDRTVGQNHLTEMQQSEPRFQPQITSLSWILTRPALLTLMNTSSAQNEPPSWMRLYPCDCQPIVLLLKPEKTQRGLNLPTL